MLAIVIASVSLPPFIDRPAIVHGKMPATLANTFIAELSLIFKSHSNLQLAFAQQQPLPVPEETQNPHKNFTNKLSPLITANVPAVRDPNLEVQLVYKGLKYPTQMAFLEQNDLLVLQKNDGKVLRITNCTLQSEPALDVEVANLVERGLLGIAISKSQSDGHRYAFIYYTHANQKDGDDGREGKPPLGNRVYRYDVVNGTLVNPKSLFNVAANRGASHNGGGITIGPDNHLYFVVGDIASHHTRDQNYFNGSAPDGTSAILRTTFDGESAGPILGRDEPVSKFYAYGIRNSFGLDFDPVTGKLWDTENGPDHGDEINLVEPGFNSGWRQVAGFPNSASFDPNVDLVECLYCDHITGFFDRWVNTYIYGIQDGVYSDPEFVWQIPVGVTATKFLNSVKLGSEYTNDMFVADYVLGAIYHFELNEERNQLVLDGSLADKVANNWNETDSAVFAQGFSSITDLEVGPDGFLYVLLFKPTDGAIYRIVPKGTPDPC